MFIRTGNGWVRLGDAPKVVNTLQAHRDHLAAHSERGLRSFAKFCGDEIYGTKEPEKAAAHTERALKSFGLTA